VIPDALVLQLPVRRIVPQIVELARVALEVVELADRMAVLAALASVDAVTWFEEETPLALILAARPDILVKGGDWPVEKIVGAKEVLSWGGAVHSIPFDHMRSTTTLLERIRAL